jgi:hypothetical protein
MSIKIYSKYAKIRDVVSANKGSGDLNFAQSFSNVIPKHADAEATRTTETEKARVRQLLAATGGHLVGGGTQGAHIDLDEFMRDVLPQGAARVPNAPKLIAPHANRRQAQALPGAYASQGDAQSVVTNQRPYMPEFDSPERQWLPTNRGQMNRYARMFYKLDPVVGTVLDMICDLPWGEFTLSGPEIDGSIKSAMETAVQETDLLAKLPYLLREFFVTGEAIPHLYFDSSNGIWNHLHLHNPDQIEVLHAPFIPMEPVMQFKPDPDLRKVVVSQDPMIQEVRAQMPATVINSILDGSNIPLSPVNVTLLARKMHDYDVRGTSILTRLWRVFAYEDAIFNAAISTARRQACFVAGTPILTVDGIKSIEDVIPGEKIVAGNGQIETVEGCWAQVPDGTGITEIEALGTETIRCTVNHKFKVWSRPTTCACGCGENLPTKYNQGKGRQNRKSAYLVGHHLKGMRNAKGQMTAGASTGWKVYSEQPLLRTPLGHEPLQKKEAKDLREGDYFVIPRKFDVEDPHIAPEQARLLGYWTAEGSVRSRKSGGEEYSGAVFTFSLDEAETWARDVVNCAKIAADVDALHYVYVPGPATAKAASGRVGTTTVTIQKNKDAHLATWLHQNAGVGAGNHRWSEEVMRWPLALKRELIRGYFRGDGHWGLVDDCPQVTVASTSKTLAYQVRLVLAQLGFFGSISHNPKGHVEGQENWSDCWIVSSTGRDARALADMIWGVEIEAPSVSNCRTWSDDEYVYVPIQKIKHIDENIVTYNLSVSGDKSYISAGIHSYNSPLKVAKMGDAGSGYIPPPEQEAKLLRLIAQQEIDVNAWLVWNYAVQFELVGVQERVMPITQHYPLIEQIKLAALGVNKAFINGEASFSSAAAGLTVFLQRLKALREMVVNRWILPKFFGVMALANDWVKTTEAERADGVRIKRSSKELLDQGRYITPKLEWKKTLDPNIESERIQAIQTLEQIGCKFSRRTKMSLVGVDSEDERKQVIAEAKEDSALIASDPQVAQMIGAAPAPAEGGGGMGGGMPPSVPGEAFGAGGGDIPLDPSGAPMDPTPPGPAPEGVDMGAPPSPEGAAAGDKKPRGEAGRERKDEDYVAGGWQKSFVEAGQRLLVSFDAEEALDYEPWDTILGDRDVRAALATHDPDILWEAIEDYLTEDGYPAAAVLALRGFLTSRRRRAAAAVQRNDPLRQALDKIPDSPSVTLWAGAK